MKQHFLLLFTVTLSLWIFSANAQNVATNVEIQNENIAISASGDIKLSTGTSSKAYYNNKEVAVKSDAGRGATLVIAASNASEKSKAAADYVCTGENDNEKIQEAVNYIASLGVGGKIQLTEGDYNFSDGVWFVAINNNKVLSITIEGLGSATILHRRYSSISGKAQGLFSFGLPTNQNISNKYVTTIKNLKYNGHMDIYAHPPTCIQSFATSYTERTDVLETTVYENIVCENVYNESHVFLTMGSHAIVKSLDLGNACSSYGISIVPSDIQLGNPITAVVDKCIAPLIRLLGVSNSFMTNNVAETIWLHGENMVCTGNIYNSMVDETSKSLIVNNLQVNQSN